MYRTLFKHPSVHYAPANIITIILHGTLVAIIIIAILSLLYTLVQDIPIDRRHILILSSVMYLFLVEIMCLFNMFRLVSWMLVSFYSIMAGVGFILWGTNDVMGILSACFAIVLSGVIVGTSVIFPVTITIASVLVINYCFRSISISPSQITIHDVEGWNVLLYATALHLLALVTWLSYTQLEQSINRAQLAEEIIRRQKASIKIELIKETALLRKTQIDHLHQLHKFALLGQSAAATLHELSNLLSILNLDINDLRQQYTHSQAIKNATTSIKSINKMVINARQQLDTYDTSLSFDARKAVYQITKDFKQKFHHRGISLTILDTTHQCLCIQGSSLAFMQVLTILLHNALEACAQNSNANVTIRVDQNSDSAQILLSDNGPGVEPNKVPTLFAPKISTKPTGLGVGLYIAHHIITDHFKGTIDLLEANQGAHFLIQLPIRTKKPAQIKTSAR